MLTTQQLESIAQAFSSQPADHPLWKGLLAFLADTAREAEDIATHPDTHEDKRSGWCGYARGLRDLEQDLHDLHSGAYRDWARMKRETAPEEEPD